MRTLREHLDEVGELGFREELYPLKYNGHRLYLLRNLARVTADDRLQVHFIFYCADCDRESVVRGRGPPATYSMAHLHDIKLLMFAPYLNECHRKV